MHDLSPSQRHVTLFSFGFRFFPRALGPPDDLHRDSGYRGEDSGWNRSAETSKRQDATSREAQESTWRASRIPPTSSLPLGRSAYGEDPNTPVDRMGKTGNFWQLSIFQGKGRPPLGHRPHLWRKILAHSTGKWFHRQIRRRAIRRAPLWGRHCLVTVRARQDPSFRRVDASEAEADLRRRHLKLGIQEQRSSHLVYQAPFLRRAFLGQGLLYLIKILTRATHGGRTR